MNNNNEKIDYTQEWLVPGYEIDQLREDLTGDVLASAKLVKAACDKNWNEVEKMLDEGADPRICRLAYASGEIHSALFMALKDQKFDLAYKLYLAGDRLDDIAEFTDSCGSCPDSVFACLAQEMHRGRNYFYDESRTLSECCRCSAFVRIEKLMPLASQEELDKSIEPTVSSWFRHYRQPDIYVDILKGLAYFGAKLAPEIKEDILQRIEGRFAKCPAALRMDQNDLDKMVNLIKNW